MLNEHPNIGDFVHFENKWHIVIKIGMSKDGELYVKIQDTSGVRCFVRYDELRSRADSTLSKTMISKLENSLDKIGKRK